MKIATLGLILEGGNILLGRKKQGEVGVGKISGPGGKLEEGETPSECLFRETCEEFDVEINFASLELVAVIDFHVAHEVDFHVYVYLAKILSGEAHETPEMIPAWYPIDDLPLDEMYEADRHWLPKLIRGEKFRANVYYRERAKNLECIDFFPF